MENITLRQHMDYLIQCTLELQLHTPLFRRYQRYYERIFSYCTENGIETFSYADANTYCESVFPLLKEYAVMETRHTAYTVARYFSTGKFIWKPVTVTRYPISTSYEELMDKFKKELSKTLSSGTVRGSIVITRQYLYYSEQIGVMDASAMTTDNVLTFIRQEAPNHKGSMTKLLRTMRKFVCFLREKGIVSLDADRYLTTAGISRRKALPCFTEDELKLIFSQIDRTTSGGLRDYAIFLLALRLGLRGSDISELRLSDINWAEHTLRITQKKTKTAIILPLPVDVGNAIADYILHGRYKTDNPFVFLRIAKYVNHDPINPTSFNFSLRKYMGAAGIPRTGCDGKTFHALRRTAGTSMVESGTPVSTVAQILGHKNIESSKCYIALDTSGLSECCLDLDEMYTQKEGLA